MVKYIALALAAMVLGGCAIVPVGYGYGDGYYRGHGYYRGYTHDRNGYRDWRDDRRGGDWDRGR